MNTTRNTMRLSHVRTLTLVMLVAACTTPPEVKKETPKTPAASPQTKAPPAVAEPTPKPPPAAAPAAPETAQFRPAAWRDLPEWQKDDPSAAWSALIASCGALGARDHWRQVCTAAAHLDKPSRRAARRFFEQSFTPYQVVSTEGGEEGLITGYYEPLLRGSRRPSSRYRFPLYGVPDDLVVVELADVYPELKSMRLRGRVEGRKLVPYPDRARIDGADAPLRGKEIAWVDDEIDLFFLHIQGSGRIQLDDGETMRVGYAEQNGHPYRSIGRILVQRGELALEQASMQSIKAWARERPDKASELLNSNASYVFFRELPSTPGGPPGSLGVPLTAERSIAVDRRHVPLGAPVFIATTWPNSARPLNRLVLAQDTGGAIRGPVRADFFWGHGERAAVEAGRMKQRLRMWVLLPHGHPIPESSS
jgi:membrane-bound lytic murein transglycosylase A